MLVVKYEMGVKENESVFIVSVTILVIFNENMTLIYFLNLIDFTKWYNECDSLKRRIIWIYIERKYTESAVFLTRLSALKIINSNHGLFHIIHRRYTLYYK